MVHYDDDESDSRRRHFPRWLDDADDERREDYEKPLPVPWIPEDEQIYDSETWNGC